MKKTLIIALLLAITSSFGQSKLQFTLHSIPNKGVAASKNYELVLGRYYDGEFHHFAHQSIVKDTVAVFTFEIPNSSATGLYTIFIGDNSEKEINKAEFIWNPSENLKMDAHFYQLKNGELSIEKSRENEVYTKFNLLRNEFENTLEKLVKKRLSNSLFDPNSKQKAIEIEHETENIQYNYNNKLAKLGELYPNTYVTQTLIPLALIPVRSVKEEWAQQYDSYFSFLHQNFFMHCNTKDNSNLYHYAFQDKIFYYLSTFCDKNEEGTKKGVDIIMQTLKSNSELSSFTYNLLLKTFIKLESEPLSKYLMEKYGNECALNLPFEELKKLQTLQALSVGGLAPEISLPDKEGKYHSLREYTAKNKVTLVVVWLSWCARCQSEIPKLNELYNQYKSAGLGIYAVSLDEKKEDWEKVTTLNKNWKNVCEMVPIKKSTVVANYNVTTTPALYVLDSNGKILSKNSFGSSLQTLLKELLNR
ncbi:TlpA disulfide reductase family protein [Flavobacterium sp.]|uniref:TlpA family protein disulfide reductase n=1 Tax=Flavobacterium sp. TaxID=239 RepID=UPI002B4B604C|nr:TlpA disulfide reductase family protein [Flavobacterium sp.]HLP64880.1 TlpA disulfide reductase family protein [Flavobacterium sp.]